MEKNNMRTLIWVGVAIVVLVAALIFVVANKKMIKEVVVNPVTTESDSESVQDTSGQTVETGAAPISYANALVKYKDRRIQLDPMCQAHPNTVSYKDNIGIMIDNRSAKTRTVKVGSTFTIKPWGFKIVILPDVYLTAKTILVDCDQSQNVATILVQE